MVFSLRQKLPLALNYPKFPFSWQFCLACSIAGTPELACLTLSHGGRVCCFHGVGYGCLSLKLAQSCLWCCWLIIPKEHPSRFRLEAGYCATVEKSHYHCCAFIISPVQAEQSLLKKLAPSQFSTEKKGLHHEFFLPSLHGNCRSKTSGGSQVAFLTG